MARPAVVVVVAVVAAVPVPVPVPAAAQERWAARMGARQRPLRPVRERALAPELVSTLRALTSSAVRLPAAKADAPVSERRKP